VYVCVRLLIVDDDVIIADDVVGWLVAGQPVTPPGRHVRRRSIDDSRSPSVLTDQSLLRQGMT